MADVVNNRRQTEMKMQFTYGNDAALTIDVVNDEIICKLAQRGYNHIMGNECHSACPKDGEEADWTKARIEWRVAKVKQILDGTLGMREGGPRKDPVEAKFDALVVAFVKAQLKAHGHKFPKTDDEVIDFGNGQTRTRPQMIARAKETQGEKLMAEARRQVAAESRMTAAKKTDGPVNVEALGI